MALRACTVMSLFVFTTIFAGMVFAQDAGTQCYVLDGAARSNFYRCNNETTGHSTCCEVGYTCYSNGVCQGYNDGVVDYLREGCTDPTWQDPACLDVCVQYANASTAGVRWCGSSILDTTDYCCDTGAQGIGSFACCNTASNHFSLAEATVVATLAATAQVSYPPATTTSSSSSSSAITSSGSTVTSTSRSTSAPTQHNSTSSNKVAIGAGVGVSVAVIAALGIGFFFWRKRKSAKARQAYELQSGGAQGYQQTPYADQASPYGENSSLDASAGQQSKGYYAGRQYDPPAPQEMPLNQAHVVHEMGTDSAVKR